MYRTSYRSVRYDTYSCLPLPWDCYGYVSPIWTRLALFLNHLLRRLTYLLPCKEILRSPHHNDYNKQNIRPETLISRCSLTFQRRPTLADHNSEVICRVRCETDKFRLCHLHKSIILSPLKGGVVGHFQLRTIASEGWSGMESMGSRVEQRCGGAYHCTKRNSQTENEKLLHLGGS